MVILFSSFLFHLDHSARVAFVFRVFSPVHLKSMLDHSSSFSFEDLIALPLEKRASYISVSLLEAARPSGGARDLHEVLNIFGPKHTVY